MKKILCDLCKKELINGEPFQQIAFPAEIKDGKIISFYAQSDICSNCLIKITKMLKVVIIEKTESPSEISPLIPSLQELE